MSEIAQVALVTIAVFTCFVTAYCTDYNVRKIRKKIREAEGSLRHMGRVRGGDLEEARRVRESLHELKKELLSAEHNSWLPTLPKGRSLRETVLSSLPIIIGIIVGVMVGAVVIVFIPVVLVVALFTIATLVGSSGLFSEFVRSEKRALGISVIPAGLYAMTQVFVILGLSDLFNLVFWVFDLVVIVTLIGVSMILGKELQLEIVMIIISALFLWDIYAVLFTKIMATAVSALSLTLFSVLIPTGTGHYSILGGGDFFFSFLLVTAFTRRLKKMPTLLILLIGASVAGLIVVMGIIGLAMAPALPAVYLAGLLSALYYRKELKRKPT